MALYAVAVCYNARQDNSVQYSTVQYSKIHYNTVQNTSHKITLNTQGNHQYAEL